MTIHFLTGILRTYSMPQTLEQRRRVDLIGLVVAGQGVHHDIDAEAERHFPLIVAAGRNVGELPPLVVDGPRSRPVVAADDHRRHAIAAPRGSRARSSWRQRLDPDLPPVPASGKTLDEIERLRQDVVG